MKLISNDFKNMEILPKTFTCDGEDISPHLKLEDVPAETKNLALSCFNLESNYGTVSHWLIINIPNTVRELKQGSSIDGEEIKNDFSVNYYRGPCEPDKLHKYTFTIYALNTERIENINSLNFKRTIRKHLIESAELIGVYQSEFKIKLSSCRG